MICSSRGAMKSDEFQPLSESIFVCGRGEMFKIYWQRSKSPKPKSSSTNHFTSSSSKLAISSHAETFVNQSFRWFNGVIKCSSSSRFVTRVHKNVWRCNIIEGVQRLFNHRVQGWRGRWRKSMLHILSPSHVPCEKKMETIFSSTSERSSFWH